MTTRRPFGHERHATTKLALAALTFAGFAAAWLGFRESHPRAAVEPATATPSAASATIIPAGSATAALAAEATAVPTRARTSRGS